MKHLRELVHFSDGTGSFHLAEQEAMRDISKLIFHPV